MRKNSAQQTLRVTQCGMLLALMLVLGFVESRLPVPGGVPGIKLGLSNGVLIFAVYLLDIPTSYTLMLLKVLLSAMTFGNFDAFWYALAGGLLSLTLMVLVSRVKGVNIVVVSMLGGLAHNVGQVLLAMYKLHLPPQILVYMAILMVAGVVTGCATGVAATGIIRRFQKKKKPVA